MDTKRLILIAGSPAPVAPVKAVQPVIQKVEYVKVLVATQNLSLGSRLNEAAIEWKQWPAEAVSPAFISNDLRPNADIQPGDRVDIILTQTIQRNRNGNNQSGNKRLYVSDTVFENVHVLAIDQTFSTSAESGATKIGSTATFEMSQEDSELLQEVVAKGDLSLTLRGIRNSRAKAPTTATFDKEEQEEDTQSILTVYRGGQPQQVAIKGK